MKKRVFGAKLSRNRKSRTALFRSLISALVINGKIVTTKVKAKAIQGDVDKLMGHVSRDTLASRRLVLARMANKKDITEKLFSMKKMTEKRKSGFTRIINLPRRKGDNAEMVRMEFVE